MAPIKRARDKSSEIAALREKILAMLAEMKYIRGQVCAHRFMCVCVCMHVSCVRTF
jgi:hypothetical protein